MITINGYFKGITYNEDTRGYEVKTIGSADGGAVLCGLNVSGKDQQGNRIYGKPIDVKINFKSGQESLRVKELINKGQLIECQGFFVPNNWTNKEGKEIKGNQFLVNDSRTFIAAGTGMNSPVVTQTINKTVPRPEPIDAGEIPF